MKKLNKLQELFCLTKQSTGCIVLLTRAQVYDILHPVWYTAGVCSSLGKGVKHLLCLALFVLKGSDVKPLMLEHRLLEVHSLWISSCQWPGLDKGQLTFLRILQAAEAAKRNKPTQIHNSFSRAICQEIQKSLLGGNASPAETLRLKALGKHCSGKGCLFTSITYQARIA